jgi:mono/diheme cytochrome c family protein
MSKLRIRVTTGLFAFIAPVATASADVDEGRRIAERWCAACHVVSSEQTTGAEAPPFSELANRFDFRSRPLAEILAGPHPAMPAMQLGREDSANLTAYIRSLKK